MDGAAEEDPERFFAGKDGQVLHKVCPLRHWGLGAQGWPFDRVRDGSARTESGPDAQEQAPRSGQL